MEIPDIIKLLVKISNKLWDHTCALQQRRNEECRNCMLAIDIDFVIFNLRGKKK